MIYYLREMARRRSRATLSPRGVPGAPTCCFCGSSEDDEVEFGKLWTHDGIVTHYYCLLLSSNMEQNGNDNEGILGFLTTDIQKELRRGRRLHCVYCKRVGATLGCCNTRCKRVFHLPCGLREGSLHQFFGEFRSYCITHRINQEIDEHIKAEAEAAGTVTCCICYEEVCPENGMQTLWAPCCRKNAWFHRKCAQRLALSAGYFFKCPLCNNKDDFQKSMLDHGIFIPHQDASWEMVPNAYQELLHRHNRCDAAECICPKGRNHTSVNAKWELLLCRLCGSQGVHKACGNIKWASSVWECAECVGMLRKGNEASPRIANESKKATSEILENESSSDSEISVGDNTPPPTETSRPDSPPNVTPPVKLRPGPRSFKLQQAVRNSKSVEITRNFVPVANHDSPLPSRSVTIEVDTASREKCTTTLTESNIFSSEIGLALSETAATKMNTTNTERRAVTLETANAKLTEAKHGVAEVIVIDSDDEVEIISETPKQNILTTKDGVQIPILSLSQMSKERHNAEGDVKVTRLLQSEPSKPLSALQSKPISSAKSTVLKIRNPALISTITPQTPLPNVLESLVIKKTTKPTTGVRKSSESHSNVNSVDIDKNDVQENSVMNLKITNVTSLRQEDFSNPFRAPTSFQDIGFGNSVQLHGGQQVHIMKKNSSAVAISQSRTTAYQRSAVAIKDPHAKRKSEEYIVENAPSSSNNRVKEHWKKARISERNDSGISVEDQTIAWSINMNDENGETIPLLIRSVPMNCLCSNDRSQESKATLNPNELKANNTEGAEPITSIEVQKKNGAKQSLSSLYRRTPGNDMIPVGTTCTKPTLSAKPMHYIQVTKTEKTYSAKQNSSKNSEPYNINQQATVNVMQNLGNVAPKCFEPSEFTSTQQIADSSKLRAPKNLTKHIQKLDISNKTMQTNMSTSDVIFYNSSRGRCVKMFDSSSGNQQSINDGAKLNESISNNGIPILGNCDGDAGSDSPAEARSHRQAFRWCSIGNPAEPITINIADEPEAGRNSVLCSSLSTCVSTNSPIVSLESSGGKCDKPRLMPVNVPLENIQFRVLNSETVEIVFQDSTKPTIRTDTQNADVQSSMIQQTISARLSVPDLNNTKNDESSKFSSKYKLPSDRSFHKIKNTLKQYTSQKNGNPEISRPEIKNSSIINGNIKASSVIKMKYSDGSDFARNGTVSIVSETDYTRKINSTAKPMSTKLENKNCLSKENLFEKENRPCPALGRNHVGLNKLCEKDENVKSIEGSKCISTKSRITLVKMIKVPENSAQTLSLVDMRCKKNDNCFTNEEGTKLSNVLTDVSESSIENLDDFPDLNSSVDRYTSSKNTVGRSSEPQHNTEDSTAKIEDRTRRNHTSIHDLGIVNQSKRISENAKLSNEEETTETNCIRTSSSTLLFPTKNETKNKIKDNICSKQKAYHNESGFSMRVKINLDKIQDFINGKPHLFDKGNSGEKKW